LQKKETQKRWINLKKKLRCGKRVGKEKRHIFTIIIRKLTIERTIDQLQRGKVGIGTPVLGRMR